MLNAVVEGIGYAINNFLFFLWRGGAVIVDFVERLFRLFAGLEPTYNKDGVADNSDVFGRLISNVVIAQIFQNLIIAATVLLMFFTIIQIIRIQYKEKEGGSPYTIVFRMFKAMVMFMFITAACVVGMQASKVILQALDSATKSGTSVGMGGTIFNGMAADANRVMYEMEDNQFTSSYDEKMNLITTSTNPMWHWNSDQITLYAGHKRPGESPSPHAGDDTTAVVALDTYISKTTGIMFFNIPLDVLPNTATPDFSFLKSTYAYESFGNKYRLKGNFASDQLWAYDNEGTAKLVRGSFLYGSSRMGYVYPESGYYSGDVWGIPAGEGDFNGTYTHRIRLEGDYEYMEKIDYSSEKVPQMGVTTEGSSHYVSGGGLEYVITGDKPQLMWNYVDGKFEEVFDEHTFIYLAVSKPFGGSNPLRSLGAIAKRYYYIRGYPSTPLREFYNTNVCGVHPDYLDAEKADLQKYGLWINEVMKNKGAFPGIASEAYSLTIDNVGYLQIQKSGSSGFYDMSYMNMRAVNTFYYVNSLNWLIGFGGIFLAIGVYLSFMFGLIQRLAELALLYVFSPITLAFFPFDDGAMFNNSFVKPFYKKAISAYAPILSLNLFFPIMNVFDSINWFNPNTDAVKNFMAQCFVTIALLSMLPKMRTTVQSMLGADALEEKKLSQVFKDAWKNTGKAASSGMLETAKAWNRFRKAHGKSFIPGVSEFKGLQDKIRDRKAGNRALNEKIAEKRGWKRTADGKGWFNEKTGKTISGAQLMAERMSARRTDRRQALKEKKDAKLAEKNGLFNTVDDLITEGKKLEAMGGKANLDAAQKKYEKAASIINGNKALRRKFGESRGLTGDALDRFTHRGLGVSNKAFEKGGSLENYKTRRQQFQEKKNEEFWSYATNDSVASAINGDARLRAKYTGILGIDSNKKLSATDVQIIKGFNRLDTDAFVATAKNAGKEYKDYTNADIDKYEKREKDAAAISKNKSMIGAYLSQRYAGKKEVLEKFTKNGVVDEGKLKDFLLGTEENPNDAWLNQHKNMRREFNIEEKAPKFRSNFLSKAGHNINMWKNQSALMGMLFDMDNGLFAQTKAFKTIDSFGYNATLKAVEKIGQDKEKRLEDDAYGKARAQRMVGGFYKNLVEKERMAEQRTKAESYVKQYGGFQEANDVKQKQMVFDSSQYAYNVFKNAGATGKVVLQQDVLKGFDADTIEKVWNGGIGSITDKSVKTAVADRLSARFDILANGTKDDLTKKYSDDAMTIEKSREQLANSALLTNAKESVKEYHEVREVVLGKDKKVLENLEAFDREQSKRLSQIAEMDGVNKRVLGISDEAAKKLAEAQRAIFDKDNDFNKIKAAYDSRQSEVTLKDGTRIDVKYSDPKWFAAMQAAAYAPFEKVMAKEVNHRGVAFRDYVEKSGDRIDGLVPTKIAAEQIKLMQDTVSKVSDATSQLFRTKYFTECVADGNFQKLATELRNAYEGKDHSLDKTIVGGISKRSELRELAEMFSNLYGDANGEKRGGGFASASNIIANTFRMAFVDKMTEAMNATIAEFDARQRSYQMSLQKYAAEGANMFNSDAKLIEKFGGKVNLAGIDASDANVKEYHNTLDKMTKAINAALAETTDQAERMKYNDMLREIESKKSEVSSNVYIKQEQDEMMLRSRYLENIDVIPRSTMHRAKAGGRE